MAICRYCGKKAGWFSDAHEDCVRKANEAVKTINSSVSFAVIEGKKYEDIKAAIEAVIEFHHVPQPEALAAIKEGWSKGAEKTAGC